jgi:hypothetical protein
MRTTLTALLYLLIALPLFSQSSPKYSLTQVQEDLDFLYHSLRDAQFAPFTEVTEEDFKQKYNDLRSSVQQDSFTLLEATNLLQPLVSMLDNGHTNIGFPVTSYLEYAESGGTLFPVEIALENGKALVRRNLSKNRNIRIGSQVHAINGVPIEEILDKIYPHIPAYEPQPASKRFRGDVYVLVNRQSHSQATVTAAQIQDYGFGTIVGEETGDFPSLTASVFNYYLPNTSIRVMVAKGAMVRVNGSKKKEGVIPDLLIRDHLLDEKDEIMEGLLRRLGKKL